MEQTFYVLKEEGEFYPMAFVSPADKGGEYRKEAYKLTEGQEIVVVKFVEQTNN